MYTVYIEVYIYENDNNQDRQDQSNVQCIESMVNFFGAMSMIKQAEFVMIASKIAE